MTIGTSDKGSNVHDIPKESMEYNHALIVYGGLQGLEPALENDDKLNVEDPSLIFDYYLNAVPGQGKELFFIDLNFISVFPFRPLQVHEQFERKKQY